jgi:ribosomal protein S18 acetylase RimI-like enzyme
MYSIREMTISDYDQMLSLWQNTDGIGLGRADSRECIASFLVRNPGSSFVAEEDGQIIGTVLCGHDGRRGFLYHMAVHPAKRRMGIGSALEERCMDSLRSQGIQKCHIMVKASNTEGARFWHGRGWQDRTDIRLMSKDV